MKHLFPGYYRPTEQEFQQLWAECAFAFDANMLLNIYRYTSETRELFLSILEQLKDRIWIPNQAALEFSKNREGVIDDQLEAYDEIARLLDEAYQRIKNQLKAYERHPSIKIEEPLSAVKSGIDAAKESLATNKKNHPDLSSADPQGDRVSAVLAGRIGKPFSLPRQDEICKEGKLRYEHQVPPGYRDTKEKKGENKYGDLILWFQIIDYAKSEHRPVILVTHERKDDWWLKEKGEIVSPRPELINEIHDKAAVNFYMYQGSEFIRHAQNFLGLEDQEAAVEEVEALAKQDEANQEARDYFTNWNHIGKRYLEKRGMYDNLLAAEAAQANRALRNPWTRQAIETAKSFERSINIPQTLRILEDAKGIDSSLASRAAKNLTAHENLLAHHAPNFERLAHVTQTQQLIESATGFNQPFVRQAIEAARFWKSSHLSGMPIPRDMNLEIDPKRSEDLLDSQTANDIKVEVVLHEGSTDFDEPDTSEAGDNERSAQPYDFATSPRTIALTHRSNSPRPRQTSHRLRIPTFEEWIAWSRNLERSRRYFSPSEIDEYNTGKDDEEKATEIWSPAYSEWHANELLYDTLILEVAGVDLDKDDEFPSDRFLKLPSDMIAKLYVEIKSAVIEGLYECYCDLGRVVSSDNEQLRKVNQYVGNISSSSPVTHILRKPTDDESYYFRTNIMSGSFATDEEQREIIELRLNLSIADEFYDRLIVKVEDATVGGQPFSERTRDEFLKAINPVHKLRVLEPLFNINAWYFSVDDIVFP